MPSSTGADLSSSLTDALSRALLVSRAWANREWRAAAFAFIQARPHLLGIHIQGGRRCSGLSAALLGAGVPFTFVCCMGGGCNVE